MREMRNNVRGRGRDGMLWSIIFWALRGWALLGNRSSDDLYKSDPSAICPRGKGPIRPFPEDLEAVNG